MKSALSLSLAVFLLGAALGGLGFKVWTDRQATVQTKSAPTGAAAVDRSQQTVAIAEQDVQLTIRQTDAVARIKGEAEAVIGVRVFDTWSGDPNTATSSVDLIWERQEQLFDQPEATTLDAFRQPTTPGLTINETKELTIDGRPALKQLYSIEVEVPGPFGSTSKQPLPNQLRYVIADGERFLVLRAPGSRQTFLDAVALSLKFKAAGAGAGSPTSGISVDSPQPSSGHPISSPLPVTGTGSAIELKAQ